MIIYCATKKEFSEDVLREVLVTKLIDSLRAKRVSGIDQSQVRAFQNSLRYMDTVLQTTDIPENSGIAIEFMIPSSRKRIDFIISGRNDNSSLIAILIELKQWESAELTNMDAIVRTFIKGRMAEVEHPSYQAWSYAALLEDYNETVREKNVILKPCAYLHNYRQDQVITNNFYSDHLEKAPVFLKHDAEKLRDFITKYVKYGDSGDLARVYRVSGAESSAPCF
jgi:hypothetical protein